jgi:hypothetical protein
MPAANLRGGPSVVKGHPEFAITGIMMNQASETDKP